MPLSLEEKRIFDSSDENDAPLIRVLDMNCSIVYCLDGRAGPAAVSVAAAKRPASAMTKRAPEARRFAVAVMASSFRKPRQAGTRTRIRRDSPPFRDA